MRLRIDRELRTEAEVAHTRDKLRLLEESYDEARNRTAGDEWDQELQIAELDSLGRIINQFKEEIARYEAHQPARR